MQKPEYYEMQQAAGKGRHDVHQKLKPEYDEMQIAAGIARHMDEYERDGAECYAKKREAAGKESHAKRRREDYVGYCLEQQRRAFQRSYGSLEDPLAVAYRGGGRKASRTERIYDRHHLESFSCRHCGAFSHASRSDLSCRPSMFELHH